MNKQLSTLLFLGLILYSCTRAQVVADIDTSSSTETETETDPNSETLVLVGKDCFLGYSEDGGLSWSVSSQSGSCGGEILEGIAYGNGVWMVVGSEETVFLSEDGKAWSQVQGDIVIGSRVDFESIVFDGADLWIAGGSGGKLAYSEDYGETWTSPNGGVFPGLSLQSIATDGAGRWVAVSDGGNIAYSDTPKNANSWVTQEVTFLDFESVTYGDGMWIAVGGSGSIFSSDDGIDWDYEGGNCPGNDFEDVLYNGKDQWLIVGNSGCLAISETGLMGTWTEVSLGGSNYGVGCSYVSSLQRWVVADYDGEVFYSEDSGSSWESVDDDSVLTGTTPILIRGN